MDIEYTRGREIITRKGSGGTGAIVIGRMPIMLRSDRHAFFNLNKVEMKIIFKFNKFFNTFPNKFFK